MNGTTTLALTDCLATAQANGLVYLNSGHAVEADGWGLPVAVAYQTSGAALYVESAGAHAGLHGHQSCLIRLDIRSGARLLPRCGRWRGRVHVGKVSTSRIGKQWTDWPADGRSGIRDSALFFRAIPPEL